MKELEPKLQSQKYRAKFQEGANINKSLTTLVKVISTLAEFVSFSIRAKLKELEPKLLSQILRKSQIERIRSIKRMGQNQQKSHHLGQGYFVLGRIGKFSIRAKLN